MANATLVSTTLPKLVAEIARYVMNAERALTPAQANVTMTFGDALVTIAGSLPVTQSIDTASGNIVTAFTDYLPALDPVTTGTPISDITTDNMLEALYASVVRLDAAEAARLAANGTLPAGVGSSLSIVNGVASFTAVLPVSYSVDNSGNQVATISNYLA